MARTLIVSNRLPVTFVTGEGTAVPHRSSGGLASALRPVHDDARSLWIGWPGDLSALDDSERATRLAELRDMRMVPVVLAPDEVRLYYDGFSNGVLWPLFHYLIDKIQLDAKAEWESYVAVNERFAGAVASVYEPGDTIWVQDYHLALVPRMLRQRLPDARIGFFLHSPFPSADVFRILPWREQILRGLLGADLVGFHTAGYAYNFAYVAAQLLGVPPTPEEIVFDDRHVKLGVYPVGVDFVELDRLARSDEVSAELDRLRLAAPDKLTVLGVDRLDYTKGIPRRLLALERLLEQEPGLRHRLHFVQVAIPTREHLGAYEGVRRRVHEAVGRINGRFGTATSTPVHFLHRSVSSTHLAALYRAADVMLVTPIRDGMNLVAKEYVASRVDEDGVLVLSELAGAATELREALHVNPYDIDAIAHAIGQGAAMPRAERRVRMRALRRTVRQHDVHHWARAFLGDLGGIEPAAPASLRAVTEPLERAIAAVRAAPERVLLLDYDGTLVPFAAVPDLAIPDDHLLRLLGHLCARRGTHVHVVSGRSHESLGSWLGDLPVTLHAEHGFWTRAPGGDWMPLQAGSLPWKASVRAVLEDAVERTDASLLEEKTSGLAWHYRSTEPQLAALRVIELRGALATLPSRDDFDVLEGRKVLEVRARGVHKGLVVGPALAEHPGAAVLAAGDDRTDEDLFRALPARAVSVRVGGGPTVAAHRVAAVADLRRLLGELALEEPS